MRLQRHRRTGRDDRLERADIDALNCIDCRKPLNNVENDFYARDTSKKERAIKWTNGQAGQHLGEPPYGYIKDPAGLYPWVLLTLKPKN